LPNVKVERDHSLLAAARARRQTNAAQWAQPGGVTLPPINSDGTSVYQRKGGSTIPLKFTVCDANDNPISDLAAVFAGTSGQLTMLSAVRGQVQ
jgi:hypothetical protein